MKTPPVAAAFVVGATGLGCASSPPEWVVPPTPDAVVVVGEGWQSVLPRTWSLWQSGGSGEERGTYFRSRDAACLAGAKMVEVNGDAKGLVQHLGSPSKNITSYLDRWFRPDLGGQARINRHWIGGRLTAELEVERVAHADVEFHEWASVTVAGAHTVLVATCTAPEDLAEATSPVCEAFLANIRFAGDPP